jgi:ATP-dependent DNA helicase RecG
LIEAWGRGTLRILNDCKMAGAPIPIFQYNFSGFIVEFDLKTSDKLSKTSDKPLKTSDKPPKTSDKPSDKTSDKPSDKTSDKILDLIKSKPKITIKELAESTSISARVVETHLQNLKQNHKIIRKGGRKMGEWEVI